MPWTNIKRWLADALGLVGGGQPFHKTRQRSAFAPNFIHSLDSRSAPPPPNQPANNQPTKPTNHSDENNLSHAKTLKRYPRVKLGPIDRLEETFSISLATGGESFSCGNCAEL